MMRNKRKILFVIAALLFCSLPVSADDGQAYDAVAMDVYHWKAADGLMSSDLLESAGTPAGDWYAFAAARLNTGEDTIPYLAVLEDALDIRYAQDGGLSDAKATEWHRAALTDLALGGDPTGTWGGQNLIADGTYASCLPGGPGAQGINGWIWALITLDSLRYAVPEGAAYTRAEIISQILSAQLPDGGFDLSGLAADPDMTAMAVTALAPYHNSEEIYSYQDTVGAQVQNRVRDAVDLALAALSGLQLESGGYASWGTENLESVSQVMIAVCSLGIDPLEDARFIKDGHTLLDALMYFQMTDGGFVHSFTAEGLNPETQPDASNALAGEQAMLALCALWRQSAGMRTLYDLRSEMDEETHGAVSVASSALADLNSGADAEQVAAALALYEAVPLAERSYVIGYAALSDSMAALGMENDLKVLSQSMEQTLTGRELTGFQPDVSMTQEDEERAGILASQASTQTADYAEIVTLLYKLHQQSDGADLRTSLEVKKEEITARLAEIGAIEAEILEKLYPLNELKIGDLSAVNAILNRLDALPDSDRQQVSYYDDVVGAKTIIDTQIRTAVIAAACLIVLAVLVIVVIRRMKKRKLERKRRRMELLDDTDNWDDEP